MITYIGLCAGEIWQLLERKGTSLELKQVFSEIDAPQETILMAMGWLARESHIVIKGTFPNPTIEFSPHEKII